MADTDFTRFVPGFDFLQGLVKNAGAAIPGFNQWVAPTLNPQELDKRIDELRTVQFWLEQNARMLAATIQALEVQRMTLSTLHAMNVPMADLKEVLKTAMPQPPSAGAAPTAPWHAAKAAPAAEDPLPHPLPQAGEGATPDASSSETSSQASSKASDGKSSAKGGKAETEAEAKPAGADPMQWWNALTQQFTQVAANAMKTAQTAAAAATGAAASATGHAAPKPAARTAAKTAGRAASKSAGKSTTSTAKGPAKAPAKSASTRKPAAKRKTS